MRKRRLTRAERARETRDAIVQAAARLFLRSGIEATSLDAVAAELGLTKGAVYGCFPSKGDLVEAVAVEYSTLPSTFDPLLQPAVPLARRVREFAERVASSKVSRQVVLLDLEYVIYSARNRRWEKMARTRFDAQLRSLAARFRAANQTSGERVLIGEEAFLRLLNVLTRGLVQEMVLHPTALGADDVVRMVALLASVGSGSPAQRHRPRGRTRP